MLTCSKGKLFAVPSLTAILFIVQYCVCRVSAFIKEPVFELVQLLVSLGLIFVFALNVFLYSLLVY